MSRTVSLWLLFSLSLLAPCWAEVVSLKSFAEVKDALIQGYQVRVVAHYGKCRLMLDGKETQAPDAIGGMPVGTFEYFAKNSIRNPQAFLAFSATNLINHKGYIYNYGKFKIFADNRVEILAQYAKPVTFRVIMDETFHTVINNGTNDGAVYFFCEK